MEKGKEWFSEWFDSRYYHLLYQHRNYEEAERFIGNLIGFLKPDDSAHILDLACGKGRHSLFLNKQGYRVTGLDLSSSSIKYAKQFENDRLYFDVHDMREVYQPKTFDIILNLFTSFGYFDSDRENEKVVGAMDQQLKPDGTLVIDYMNSHKVIKDLVTDEVKENAGITFRINRKVEGRNVIKTIRFNADGASHEYTECVELLTLADFQNYLHATRLQIFHTFGGYNLQSYDPETSDRLIIVANKEN